MNHIKIERYIVSLESIHGVLLNCLSPSSKSDGSRIAAVLCNQVIITYNGGNSACLEFDDKESATKAFNEIGDALGAL